ncbi:MAG TPA: oligosaccharide flippase family protein [Vicinamibacterales bacterium]|nr:oligosaccharide flippase family protein [Vicinamibacterales bacterium]
MSGDAGVPVRIVLKGLADVAGKAAMLVITVAAARRLNPDPFAIMAYAMATGWLLGVATDAGLSMYLARETARAPRRSRQFVIEIISVRAGLAFFAATVTVLLSPVLVPAHWRLQFVIVMLAQLCGAIVETIAHYFRGLQRSEIEAAIHAGYRLTMLIVALAVLWWWRRLDYLGVAMLVPGLLAIAVSMIIALRLAGRSDSGPSLSVARFVKHVLPLGSAVLISALYFRIDVYFIQQWHGFQQVGGYNAAFRLVEALRLLPAAVMAVTFPLLVQARDTDLVRRIGGRLALAGGVLAIFCALGADTLISLVYGTHYTYAAPAFAVLSLTLPLFFLNYALTHQVIGWDGHRAYLAIVTLALAANIAANMVLVPERGITGAAIATLLTELVVTAGCLTALASQRATVPHDGSTLVPRGGSTVARHEGSPT